MSSVGYRWFLLEKLFQEAYKKNKKQQFLYRWNLPAARVCEIPFWRTTTFLNNPDSIYGAVRLRLWTSNFVLVELLKEKTKKRLVLTGVSNEMIITRLYGATV